MSLDLEFQAAATLGMTGLIANAINQQLELQSSLAFNYTLFEETLGAHALTATSVANISLLGDPHTNIVYLNYHYSGYFDATFIIFGMQQYYGLFRNFSGS